MGIKLVTVDAFTRVPFTGNPAGVCLLPSPADVRWMQSIAKEMNLSETAFVVPRDSATLLEAHYDIRWFTPIGVEVALCGHATLASAHVLWEQGNVSPAAKIVFHSKSGPLAAERAQVGKQDLIELDFPARPERPYEGDKKALSRALKVSPRYVGAYADDLLAVLDDERKVRDLSPDLSLLKGLKVRGVAVTAPPNSATEAEGYDFVSRFFAPGVGIDEDPVTGSAHTCLGPYWARRLGKNMVVGYQASARGGTVRVRVDGNRVKLGGQAVTMVRGEVNS